MAYWTGYIGAMGLTFAVPAAAWFFLFTRTGRGVWLAPLRRRRRARLDRRVTMEQARRDARTTILESELDQLDAL